MNVHHLYVITPVLTLLVALNVPVIVDMSLAQMDYHVTV